MAATRHPSIARALGEVRAVLQRAVRPGEGLLLACSGGADSMALLGLVALLAPERGGRLVVGHVDHGLRADSGADASLVQTAGKALGLPVEVASVAIPSGSGLPARARQARYAALRSMAAHHGLETVVTGHTATDQLETMLMHLARGAGLVGLGGMPTRRRDVVRPLLGLTRSEVREVATRLGPGFVDDPTNEDTAHPRVAMRSAVLPALRGLNPEVERAAVESASLLRSAAEVIEELSTALLAAQATANVVRPHGWSAHRAVVRLQALRTFLVVAGVDAGALTLRILRSVDAALLEWDAHLEGQSGEIGSQRAVPGRAKPLPGGARPRTFHVRPRRCLRVDRGGLRVEVDGEEGPLRPNMDGSSTP